MPLSRRGPSTAWPLIWIVPPLGFTRPATIISNVLLPHPEGPSTETNSLCVTDKCHLGERLDGVVTAAVTLGRADQLDLRRSRCNGDAPPVQSV